MTDSDIRALDGPALSRLAYELGLAPLGTVAVCEVDHRDSGHGTPALWLIHIWEKWEPHRRLDHANAVFRCLRRWGCATALHWTPGGWQSTEAWVYLDRRGFAASWPPDGSDAEEATALLLVSVLAVQHAAEKNTEALHALD